VSVLTFVHIADEPIDIIREMGAYFDSKQRKKIINAISKSQERNITDDVRKILNRYQYNSLKYDSVKTDIYSLLSQASKQCAKGIFSSLENGMIDWRRAILQLERIYKPQNVWLFNAIAAHFAQTHVSSIDPIISDIGGENAEYQCKR
jgi:hypothetical protein